jgi:hypothetical protein
MQEKKCIVCNQIKKVTEFNTEYHSNRKKYYTRNQCIKCRKKMFIESQKKWILRGNNKEHKKKYNEEYRKNNKQKLLNYFKNWRKLNLDKCKNYNIEWRKKNIERARELQRISYKRNSKNIIVRQTIALKKKKQNCNVFDLKYRIKHSLRRSLSKGNHKYECIIGLNYELLKEYLFKNSKTVNDKNLKQHHIDHIIPLKAANTEFEVIALNHYTNLQLITKLKNLKKGSKYNNEDFDNYINWYVKNVRTEKEYISLTL